MWGSEGASKVWIGGQGTQRKSWLEKTGCKVKQLGSDSTKYNRKSRLLWQLQEAIKDAGIYLLCHLQHMASIIKVTSRSKITAGAPKNLDSWKKEQEGRAKWCSLQLNQFPLRDFGKVLRNRSYRSETSHVDASNSREIRVFYLGALPFVIKWKFFC